MRRGKHHQRHKIEMHVGDAPSPSEHTGAEPRPNMQCGKNVTERTFETSSCPVPHAELLQHHTSASSPTAGPAFRLRQFNLSDTRRGPEARVGLAHKHGVIHVGELLCSRMLL